VVVNRAHLQHPSGKYSPDPEYYLFPQTQHVGCPLSTTEQAQLPQAKDSPRGHQEWPLRCPGAARQSCTQLERAGSPCRTEPSVGARWVTASCGQEMQKGWQSTFLGLRNATWGCAVCFSSCACRVQHRPSIPILPDGP